MGAGGEKVHPPPLAAGKEASDQPEFVPGSTRGETGLAVTRCRRVNFTSSLIAAVVATMLATTVLVAGAGAAGPPTTQTPATDTTFGFSVQPYAEAGSQPRDSLNYQLAAGQTITDRVEVINATSKTKRFYFYPADAFNAPGGGFALRLRTDHRVDAASWITLGSGVYAIPAHTAAIVALKVTVPADAEPGDHTAGIVAEEILPRQPLQHGTGFQTIERVATRVYIRVAGPIAPALQVRQITVTHHASLLPYVTGKNTANVTFTVVNSGNVRIALNKVSVTIAGPFGLLGKTDTVVNKKGQLAALPSELLPGNSLTLRARFSSIPPLFLMSAKVAVYGRDPVLNKPITVSGTAWFWLVPWLFLAIIVAVAVAAFLLWRRRRGRRARATGNTSGGGPSGDAGMAKVAEPDLVAAGAVASTGSASDRPGVGHDEPPTEA